jgi:hypothetical protein
MSLKRILCIFGFHNPIPYTGLRRKGTYPYKTCTRCDDLREGPTPIEGVILDIEENLKVNRDTLTEEQRWDLLLAKQQRDAGKHQ